MDEKDEQAMIVNASSSEMSQSVPTLLPDIMIEILTRLPVESLLRFRSVCKLWCFIISDPNFVKSHLSLSITSNCYAHHRLVYRTKPTVSFKSCPLYDVLYDGSVKALELDYPLKHPGKSVWIVGSCNGLLCVADEDDTLTIWNPSTRRSNRLPNIGFKVRYDWFLLYGFGYDESTDDYKVVGISCEFRNRAKDTIVKIYSLKTGKWKKIGYYHYGFPSEFYGKFLNGAIHWSATEESESCDSWKIVFLDLAKETYGEILQPVYDEGDKDLALGVLGEWVCVLCDYCGNYADVWVMKVYGVKDSWTKLVSIGKLIDPKRNRFLEVLCISNDGIILVQFGTNLVLYDSMDRTSSEIPNFDECLEAYIFVESLVSPDSP